MNQEYAVVLYDYIPEKERNDILRNRIKGTFPGFRRLEAVPPAMLKTSLKNNAKLCEKFLYAVADMYGCSTETHTSEDSLPTLSRENYLGVFAWKCYHANSKPESESELEIMSQEYTKMLLDDSDSSPANHEETTSTTREQESPVQKENGSDFMEDSTQYIGYIQETNGFYNFWPVCVVTSDSVEQLHSSDAKVEFPELGNIWLYSQERGYVAKQFDNGAIVVLTLASSDFEDNVRQDGLLQRTNYKVDLRTLERQGKVKRLADIKMYPVLHPVSQIDFTKKTIIVKEKYEYVDENDPCLIVENDILYGPYRVEKDSDGNAFVNLTSNYVVDSYRSKSGKLDYTVIPIDIPGEPHISTLNIRIDGLIQEKLDKISNQELFKTFLGSLESRKDHKSKEITPELVDEYSKSAFRTLPDKIVHDRVQRIQQFVEEQFRQEEALEDISRFVADILFKYGEEEYFSNLMDRVLSNSDLARKIQSFAIAEQRLDEIRQQCDDLQQKREEAQKKWDEETEDRNRQISELADKTNDQIRNLNIQKEKLQKEIDEIREQRDQWKQIKDLNREKDYLDRQIDDLKDKKRKLEEIGKQAEDELQNKLNDTAKNTISAAFDGKIADQVLQAAAEWNKTTQDSDFKRIAAILTRPNESPIISGEELVEYLLGSVWRYRPGYSRNDIINIFLCITQNFLTVFSGEPGTGKTSISNIVAHILGTSKITDDVPKENGIELSRYVPISIERGWTSKRDFIGYYNPLSQAFEQANKHLYDGLRLLDAEGEQSRYPYIVLLDEANLSPIEYYWADFMNICDSDSRFSKITLGNDIQLKIPPTLRFIATINNDDTTERLSPRLIDRAALIRLPDVSYEKVEDEDLTDTSFVNVVEWEALQRVFNPNVSLDLDTMPNEIYKNICKLFRENMRVPVSPRVDRAIRRYWAAAKSLFENEAGNDPTIIALDRAVAQKLLPKINGTGAAYSDSLHKLQELCEKNNLEKSKTVLTNIIRRGEDAMNYYQYF